jgi:hypothetical protein
MSTMPRNATQASSSESASGPEPSSQPDQSFATRRAALGTFLANLANLRAGDQEAQDASVDILTHLSDPKGLPELQSLTGLTFPDFAKLVDFMVETNLVAVTGEPSHETVELTPAGRTLVARQLV